MRKILFLILCISMLSACNNSKKVEKTVFSMDTHITMTAYGENAEKALTLAENEIRRIDKKYGISGISDTLSHKDEETEKLLSDADLIRKNTDGAFDIRVGAIMKAWGFHSDEFTEKNYKVPDQSEIDEALLKLEQGTDIDLGGIAKGYCADKVTEILKTNGVSSAVLSLGGNVAVLGENPDGKPWKVGIQNPFGEGVYATISVVDTSVVTSGDYVRFFEKNGKKYHHIIDAKTGYPADNDLTSVTVIGKSSTYGDAMSTALFVMGKDKAIEYWKKDKSFQMILIDKSGKIYYTKGLDIETSHLNEII